MPTITIPKDTVNRRIGEGGGRFTWPAAPYRGTIREVRTKTLDAMQGASEPWSGYSSFDVVQVGIELAPITALDGNESQSVEEINDLIGNRPYFVDLTIQDGPHTVDNVDPTERDADYWQLQRSITYIGQLARALGQLEETADGYEVADDFLDNLQNGTFNGQSIFFEIGHRRGKPNADGKRAVYDFVAEIGAS